MRLICGIYISNLSSRMAGAWKAPRRMFSGSETSFFAADELIRELPDMMEKALRGSFGAVFMAGAQYDDPRVAQGDVWQEEGGLGT